MTVNSDDIAGFVAIVIIGVLLFLDVLTTTLVLKAAGYGSNVFMEGIVTVPLIHILLEWMFLVLMVAATRFSDSIVRGTGIYLIGVFIIAWYSLVIANNSLVFLRLLAAP